jgi:RsiW-degrading membrane proteinase PrsW (M82 family)
VLVPNVVSTLFPHLPHRHARTFAVLLIAGLVLVGTLAFGGLFAPATAAASVLLPALYLFYVYEVQVYEHEPWLVVAATFVTGLVLGFLATALFGAPGPLRLRQPLASELVGAAGGAVLAQILMLLGPLLLVRRAHFDEALDGLAFGAAAALGYSLATSLVVLWPVVAGPVFGDGPRLDWALRVLRQGVLVGLVNASATALMTTSIWLRFHRPSGGRHRSWAWGLEAAIMVAFGVQVLLAVLSRLVPDLFLLVVSWLAVAMLLLCYLRLVIHQALLEEGIEHEIGQEAACSECHSMVPTMLFCPACGVARSAAPKVART